MSVELASGDVVLFLTDGLDEAMNPMGTECYGLERALEVLRARQQKPAAEIAAALCEAVRAFSAPGPQQDDLTVMVVKVL